MLAGVGEVHRPAAPPDHTGGTPVQLGHDGARRAAAHQRVAVVAVVGDEVVVGTSGVKGTDGDGLLADVEVEEAADLGLRIGLRGVFLEAADEQHLPVHEEQGLVVESLQRGAVARGRRRGGPVARAPVSPARCRRSARRLGHLFA